MSTLIAPPTAGFRGVPIRRFTVDEYHRLLAAGILPDGENTELLAGIIVPHMTRNAPHDGTLALTEEEIRNRLPPGWSLRGQLALTTADSEPEPDVAVVRGKARDYTARHPGPQDTGLVVEVADTSLPGDRTLKAEIYARAAIPIYWIVNLVDGQVEVYTNPTGPAPAPRYQQRDDYRPGDVVPLVLDGVEIARIPVGDLLP
jgi:Uma2 family endonuclease